MLLYNKFIIEKHNYIKIHLFPSKLLEINISHK